MARMPLTGSERHPLPGATSVGKADPSERLEVSLQLRRRNAAEFEERIRRLSADPGTEQALSRQEFERRFGASSEDIAAIRTFAAAHHLSVVQEHVGRCSVVLSGTVAQCNAAFGVQLELFDHSGGSYRGRIGRIELPAELHGIVLAVLGLDNRPAAAPHFRRRPDTARPSDAGAGASFTPPQIADLYNFPAGAGEGECVGIIELGGGERAADLQAYFAGLGISPGPTVTVVSVDNGQNQPTGDPGGPDGEVMLDIEVIGAIAPGANIVLYFAPNTDAGFLDAVTTAIHDATNKPSVISISWGGPESRWTQQSMTAFDSAFQSAAAMGITICVASGDSGSSDGLTDGADHVNFPASSPFALGCGGTSLQAADGTIVSETVWDDGTQGGASGGGVSSFFALPSWQEGLHATKASGGSEPLTMRGVPDVSGDADPNTGYDVRIDDTNTVIGGTSAVAPLWAGLIARLNAARGSPVGYLNPSLYGSPSALNDITQGNNGDFAATPGWDACTGLGSPNGEAIGTTLGTTKPTG